MEFVHYTMKILFDIIKCMFINLFLQRWKYICEPNEKNKDTITLYVSFRLPLNSIPFQNILEFIKIFFIKILYSIDIN